MAEADSGGDAGGNGDDVLECPAELDADDVGGGVEAKGFGRKLLLDAGGDGGIAEGVLTTRAALGLARRHNIEMPITEQMELILNEGKDPREAIKELMLRPGKHEH